MDNPTNRDLHTQAKRIKAEYEAATAKAEELTEQALQERDTKIRHLHDQGWKQADLVRAFGYTRETIRQALNPEIREQLKTRRAAKKEADNG